MAAIDSDLMVVKVGTRVVTRENPNGGTDVMDLNTMHNLALDISLRREETHTRVILVSSGAVGSGDAIMRLRKSSNGDIDHERLCAAVEAISSRRGRMINVDDTKLKAVLSAVGQRSLMDHWADVFQAAQPACEVAQVLVTAKNYEDSVERQNVIDILDILMELGVVPILNANDAVVLDELTGFGDNDQLAKTVAVNSRADGLIILSEVEGFCDKDPTKHADARVIEKLKVSDIRSEMIAAKDSGTSKNGTGGIGSKLGAAKTFVEATGKRAWIAAGKRPGVVGSIVKGEKVGTVIVPE